MATQLHETIIESFNKDFCSYLEYHLSRTFAKMSFKRIKRLWCDGILVPENDSQLNKDNIRKTKKLVTDAWIGVDGQSRYKMTIKFGTCSVGKCIDGLSLVECVPSDESFDWVAIDIQNQTITVQLK